MDISIEAVIAIIGLFISLPPSLFILWKILVARNGRRSAVPNPSQHQRADLDIRLELGLPSASEATSPRSSNIREISPSPVPAEESTGETL